jgi:hypothetical protein
VAVHRNVFRHSSNGGRVGGRGVASAAALGCDIGWYFGREPDDLETRSWRTLAQADAALGKVQPHNQLLAHLMRFSLCPLRSHPTLLTTIWFMISPTSSPSPPQDLVKSYLSLPVLSDSGLAGMAFMRSSEEGEARKCVTRDVDKTTRVSQQGSGFLVTWSMRIKRSRYDMTN